MQVYDGDPETTLHWVSANHVNTVLIARTETGYQKEIAISGRGSPSDREFEDLMERAKLFSIENGNIFLVMKRVSYGKTVSKPVPFAEYKDGNLVAFCRPPWRRGARI